jgi:Zn finger protein HypA/HybF involved in hydrogenase expression
MNEIEKVTTIQDAITWFELELKDGKCYDTCPQCNANEFALTALREKAVRSNGCEYCDDNFKFWQTQISGELPNVRYCPMCGKRLEVEP